MKRGIFQPCASCFTSSPKPTLTNYSCGVTSRSCCSVCLQGQPPSAAAAIATRACMCEVCVTDIMQAGVLCATVCVRCNSHFKSKSLTAALMPAASQVMKSPLLLPLLLLLFLPPSPPPPPPHHLLHTLRLLPADGESITASTRRSVSSTPACIIKVYSPEPPRTPRPPGSPSSCDSSAPNDAERDGDVGRLKLKLH